MSAPPEITPVVLAEAARRQQVNIRNAAIKDIARLWPLLNFDRIDKTWRAWLAPVTQVITRRHAMSAESAGLFYRASRQHAIGEPGPVDLAKLADPPTEEWVARALGYSAPHVYARQIEAKRPPERANKAALAQTLGTVSRIVLDGARTTVEESVKADPEAVGWYFKTDGDPCYFCAMLASRGVVYHADSFVVSDVQFVGDGTAKVHNGCACILAPAFSRTMKLDPIAAEAMRVYRNRGDGPALKAFRKAWENRAA